MEISKEPTGKLNAFWKNRMFQILATYLVSSWTFLEFFQFIAGRFYLTKATVDAFLVAILCILPSVLFLSWNHPKITAKIKSFFLASNLILLVMVVYFVFSGEYLGSMMKNIQFEDEDGKVQSTQVVKAQFVNSISFFEFKSETESNEEMSWMSYGIPAAVLEDLGQFQAIYVTGVWSRFNQNLQERIHQNKILAGDYFLSATYNAQGNNIEVEASLFDIDGVLIQKQRMKSGSFFELVDLLSIFIQKNLPNQQLIREVDHPISEVTSSDVNAYEFYLQGDYENALQRDSLFVLATMRLVEDDFNAQRGDSVSQKRLDLLLKNRFKLSKKSQVDATVLYHQANGNNERAIKTLINALKVNSSNLSFKIDLLSFYRLEHRLEDYKQLAYQIIEEYGIQNRYVLGLFEVLLLKGDFEEARDLMQRHFEKTDDLFGLNYFKARIELQSGNFEEAKSFLDDCLVEKPDQPIIQKMYEVAEFYSRTSKEQVDIIIDQFVGSYRDKEGFAVELEALRHFFLAMYFNGQAVYFAINDSTLFNIWTVNGKLFRQYELENEKGETKGLKYSDSRNPAPIFYVKVDSI
ncbi:MAG: hypothetical protein AAF789_07705 [Bacteroidota bacterium]